MTHVMKSGLRRNIAPSQSQSGPVSNPWLFLRRWLANPLQMGSVIPSSPALCRRVVQQVRRAPDEAVVELGAGTGVISRALLDSGVPPERLFVVEIVPDMAAHLRHVLPGATVIEGDALRLGDLLPAQWHGRIGTVICGVPMVLLPLLLLRLLRLFNALLFALFSPHVDSLASFVVVCV